MSKTAEQALGALALGSTMDAHEDKVEKTVHRLSYALAKDCAFVDGRMAGRADLILKMLAGRFGTVPETIQTKVREAPYVLVDEFAECLLTAQTIEQVFERS